MGDRLREPRSKAALSENRHALIALVNGIEQPRRAGAARTLGVELERFIVDEATSRVVTYADDPGVHELLAVWDERCDSGAPILIDGELLGYEGSLATPHGPLGYTITLEPGSQLEGSLGPTPSLAHLREGFAAFDEAFAACCEALGVRWRLLARGVNPFATHPEAVPLLPKERYRLMDAYLPRHGRYARDMMRLSASTQVSIDCTCCELRETYQLALALGPLLYFLLDNSPTWRGEPATMARASIWREVDPARCGVPAGSMAGDFTAATYVDWLLGVDPILVTDREGRTVSAGSATTADVCAKGVLDSAELKHLLSMVFPDTRLKGFLEIRDADSLPPDLAIAYAALVKGIFYAPASLDGAHGLLCEGLTDASVAEAIEALRARGWDAEVYGRPVTELADALVALADEGLADASERAFLEPLAALWHERRLPRDERNA